MASLSVECKEGSLHRTGVNCKIVALLLNQLVCMMMISGKFYSSISCGRLLMLLLDEWQMEKCGYIVRQ